MKRTLLVEINAGSVTCDDCGFLCHYDSGTFWCDLFVVNPIDYGDGPERSQECLNAEVIRK